MIKLKHVYRWYDQGKEKINSLKGIDSTINKGSIFGVIGTSGAGKSALINPILSLKERLKSLMAVSLKAVNHYTSPTYAERLDVHT